jgi:hypothetical protein
MLFPYYPPIHPEKPLDEKLMLFYSYPDYSGNALVFYEYVCDNTDYRTVWAIKDEHMYDKLAQKGGLDIDYGIALTEHWLKSNGFSEEKPPYDVE